MSMNVVNELLEEMKKDFSDLRHQTKYSGITDEEFTMTAISALVSLLIGTTIEIIAKEISEKLRNIL